MMLFGVFVFVVSLCFLMIKFIACIRRKTFYFAAVRVDDFWCMCYVFDVVLCGVVLS